MNLNDLAERTEKLIRTPPKLFTEKELRIEAERLSGASLIYEEMMKPQENWTYTEQQVTLRELAQVIAVPISIEVGRELPWPPPVDGHHTVVIDIDELRSVVTVRTMSPEEYLRFKSTLSPMTIDQALREEIAKYHKHVRTHRNLGKTSLSPQSKQAMGLEMTEEESSIFQEAAEQGIFPIDATFPELRTILVDARVRVTKPMTIEEALRDELKKFAESTSVAQTGEIFNPIMGKWWSDNTTATPEEIAVYDEYVKPGVGFPSPSRDDILNILNRARARATPLSPIITEQDLITAGLGWLPELKPIPPEPHMPTTLNFTWEPCHPHSPTICTMPPFMDDHILEALKRGYKVYQICEALDQLRFSNPYEHEQRDYEEALREREQAISFNNDRKVTWLIHLTDTVGYKKRWNKGSGGGTYCLSHAPKAVMDLVTPIKFQDLIGAKRDELFCSTTFLGTQPRHSIIDKLREKMRDANKASKTAQEETPYGDYPAINP